METIAVVFFFKIHLQLTTHLSKRIIFTEVSKNARFLTLVIQTFR